MVSTIPCPRCKTKNAKTAEICYNCKKPLKPSKKSPKKPLSSYFNTEAKIDFKIIAVGVIIFIIGNLIFLDMAYDYSVILTGFVTMMYIYLVFRGSEQAKGPNQRGYAIKVILNYLLIAFIGIVAVYALGFY